MTTPAEAAVDRDRVEEILTGFGTIAEVRWLAARVRQLEAPARRACEFAENTWKPPGRLASLLVELRHALDDDQFPTPGEKPSDWGEIDWRRRATTLRVAHGLLLQRAHELAIAAGVTVPTSFADIPAAIADDLVDELEALADQSARAYARRIARS